MSSVTSFIEDYQSLYMKLRNPIKISCSVFSPPRLGAAYQQIQGVIMKSVVIAAISVIVRLSTGPTFSEMFFITAIEAIGKVIQAKQFCFLDMYSHYLLQAMKLFFQLLSKVSVSQVAFSEERWSNSIPVCISCQKRQMQVTL